MMWKRTAYLYVPNLPIDQARMNRSVRSSPGAFALLSADISGHVLHAVNASGQALGVVAGMTFSDARSICPDLTVRMENPEGERMLMRRMVERMACFSPRVARDHLQGLYVDVAGCSHLYGGELSMVLSMKHAIEALGVEVQVALSDTPGAAKAVSRYGNDSQEVRVVPPGHTRRFLVPLPIEALDLAPLVVGECRRLGLCKIGDLLALSRHALARRFGVGTVTLMDRVFGRSASKIRAYGHQMRWEVEERIDDPLENLAPVFVILKRLLNKLCQRLAADSCGAQKFTVDLMTDMTSDAGLWSREIRTVRPIRQVGLLYGLFRDSMERMHIRSDQPIGCIRVRSSEIVPDSIQARQGELGGVSADKSREVRNGLLERLSNRFGPGRVVQFCAREDHVPEYAFSSVPVIGSQEMSIGTRTGITTGEGGVDPVVAAVPASMVLPARPLFMLALPEVLDVLVSDLRRPASVTWRRQSYGLHWLSGPERIDVAWWRDDPGWSDGGRDYWWAWCELMNGHGKRGADEAEMCETECDFNPEKRNRKPSGLALWMFTVTVNGRSRWYVHGF